MSVKHDSCILDCDICQFLYIYYCTSINVLYVISLSAFTCAWNYTECLEMASVLVFFKHLGDIFIFIKLHFKTHKSNKIDYKPEEIMQCISSPYNKITSFLGFFLYVSGVLLQNQQTVLLELYTILYSAGVFFWRILANFYLILAATPCFCNKQLKKNRLRQINFFSVYYSEFFRYSAT